MPYRLKPTNKKIIQVKRGSGWVDKFTHPTIAKAKAQLSILNRKVKHKSSKKKR